MTRKIFTESEKNELLSIINNYKHVIENKRTNAASMDLKNKAWDDITREFNASAEYLRSAKQLQTEYLNLKRLTRKNVADENKEIKATGGGQYAPKLTEVGAQVLAIMGDQVIPLSNTCDSAAAYYGEDENQIAEPQPQPNVEDNFPSSIQVDENQPCSSANIPKVKPVKEVYTKRNRANLFNNTLKKKIYEKKFQCALIEKQTNIVNYRIAQKKEKKIDLDLKINLLEYAIKLKQFENIP